MYTRQFSIGRGEDPDVDDGDGDGENVVYWMEYPLISRMSRYACTSLTRERGIR